MTMQGLKTRITTQFLAQNNVIVLPWPALSPVMNPIEHVWSGLGGIARSYYQINTINDYNIHFY